MASHREGVVLKFKFHQVIRRVFVEQEKLHFEHAKNIAVELFKENNLPEDFVFKYKDEDDDSVTVSSQLEFVEALRCSGEVLKLLISPKTKAPRVGFLQNVVKRCNFWPPKLWELHKKSIQALDNQNTEEAKALLMEALSLSPKQPIFQYNLACAYALEGNQEKALDSLEQAIEFGYSNWRHMKQDSDLSNIQNVDRFVDLLQRMGAPEDQLPKKKEEIKEVCVEEVKEETEEDSENNEEEKQPEQNNQENEVESEEESSEILDFEVIGETHENSQEVESTSPQPIVEEPKQTFLSSIRTLEEMGFNDQRKNIELLVRHNGDVSKAVQELLQN